MKFIHVADLHLDTPFSGIAQIDRDIQTSLLEAPFKAFEKLVSIAINQSVDFVLIAGDIYDASRQTVAAKHFFYQQMERLNQKRIPVVMCHGNHDFLSLDQIHLNYPENVRVFNDEEVYYFDLLLRNQETVRIYGFSYLKRWIKEDKVKQFPNNQFQTDYTIGMIHGSIATKDKNKDNYAPFNLSDLIDKDYDYWALGHIHQTQLLNDAPMILYPGTIQGKHANETGDKGAYLIEINKNQPIRTEFLSLAPIRWEHAHLIIQTEWDSQQLIKELLEIQTNYINEAQGTLQSYLLVVHLENAELLNHDLIEAIQSRQLLELVPSERQQEIFVDLIKLQLSFNHKIDNFDYDKELLYSYQNAVTQMEQGDLYQETMKELFKHSSLKNWLGYMRIDPSLKKEMIEQAKQLVNDSFSDEIRGDGNEN